MKIDGKNFMNIQEAVGWLLANNALPFQSTANYAADTEIAKSTIINPSPAEIRVGALVLFADGKVGTVSGLTASGFMVGADYTDLSNISKYVVSAAVDASGHLIINLSDGTSIDAGLLKQISSFAMSGTDLIAYYNDGTSYNCGPIFVGSLTLPADLTITDDLAVGGDSSFTGPSTFNGNVTIATGKNLTVGGNATFDTTVFNDVATFNDNVYFNQDVSFERATFAGNAVFDDLVNVNDNLEVTGDAVIDGDASVGGDLTVTGNAVLSSINGEISPSVKPIYCHPLDIKLGSDGRISCLIFNNDATPFTPDTFVAYLNNLYSVVQDTIRIMCSGVIYVSGSRYPSIFLRRMPDSDPNKFSILTQASDGNSTGLNYNSNSVFISAITNFIDGVNKIN